jgi:hypothetical protein
LCPFLPCLTSPHLTSPHLTLPFTAPEQVRGWLVFNPSPVLVVIIFKPQPLRLFCSLLFSFFLSLFFIAPQTCRGGWFGRSLIRPDISRTVPPLVPPSPPRPVIVIACLLACPPPSQPAASLREAHLARSSPPSLVGASGPLVYWPGLPSLARADLNQPSPRRLFLSPQLHTLPAPSLLTINPSDVASIAHRHRLP